MNTKRTKSLLLALALSAAGTAQAAVCQLGDVKVTGVGVFEGTTAGATLIPSPLNVLPVGAAACAGAFQGNDGFYPTTNLGYAGDGLLNGGPQVASRSILFPGGAFIGEQYPLQDLRGDGTADDPGWIMLAAWDPAHQLYAVFAQSSQVTTRLLDRTLKGMLPSTLVVIATVCAALWLAMRLGLKPLAQLARQLL